MKTDDIILVLVALAALAVVYKEASKPAKAGKSTAAELRNDASVYGNTTGPIVDIQQGTPNRIGNVLEGMPINGFF